MFLTDAGLLEKLARDRLADAAESVRAEGWGWVEVTPRVSSAELHAFQRARRSRREPTKAEAKRIEKLEAEQARLQDKLDYEDDDLSDDGAQALHEELTGWAINWTPLNRPWWSTTPASSPWPGRWCRWTPWALWWCIAGCCARNRSRRCVRRRSRYRTHLQEARGSQQKHPPAGAACPRSW